MIGSREKGGLAVHHIIKLSIKVNHLFGIRTIYTLVYMRQYKISPFYLAKVISKASIPFYFIRICINQLINNTFCILT